MPIRVVLAWIWVVVILGLCWYPKRMMPIDETAPLRQEIPHLDKLIHFGIFAIYGILAARAVARPGFARYRDISLSGLALAILSEAGQITPFVNRDAGLDDVLADAIGIVAGLGLYAVFRRRVRVPSSGMP